MSVGLHGFPISLEFTRQFWTCFGLYHIGSFGLGFVSIRNKSVNGEIVEEATDAFPLESNLHPLA